MDASISSGQGEFVSYVDLPDILIDHVMPIHFQVSLTPDEEKNIREVSETYSKGSHNRNKEWKEDSEAKRNNASRVLLDASNKWLQEVYDEMEKVQNFLS